MSGKLKEILAGKNYLNFLTDFQSDSGGPLIYIDSSHRVYNIGIVSYGIGCASTHPGVNTRVTEYLDWIIKNTSEEFFCNI